MATAAAPYIGHRARVLRALGVVPYGLRGRFRPDAPTGQSDVAANASVDATTCVLVVPGASSARARTLLDRAVQALAPRLARVACLEVVAGELAAPLPHADAALAFGDAQAQVLESVIRISPGDAMARLTLDVPDALLQADGKRRLWQAVGRLRRSVLTGQEA